MGACAERFYGPGLGVAHITLLVLAGVQSNRYISEPAIAREARRYSLVVGPERGGEHRFLVNN